MAAPDAAAEAAPQEAAEAAPKAVPQAAPEPPPATFAELGVVPWLVRALSALRVHVPTPVQAGCIPAALVGRDVVGAAETGTGKTLAFAVPVLQALAPDPRGVFAVVLTPTRELAFQIAHAFSGVGASLRTRVEVLVGGVDELAQAAALERRPHIVVATPGRLATLLRRGVGEGVLAKVKFVVVDEADRLLEEEYVGDLGDVLERCGGDDRQTLMFSATMTPSVARLDELLRARRGPEAVAVHRFDANAGNPFATVARLTQEYLFTPVNLKEVYLVHLLKVVRPDDTTIIFTARCDTAERLKTMLNVLGMRRVASMHSEMPQAARVAALQALKSGSSRALIATDVASRGLDVPAVDLVVNFDLPRKPATYVHRVGRTARAGRGGRAVSFVAQTDVELVHAIEAALGRRLALFEGVTEDAVMAELATTLKARQIASLEITDNGFMAKYDARREAARGEAKKRRRTEQRKVERAKRRQRVESSRPASARGE